MTMMNQQVKRAKEIAEAIKEQCDAEYDGDPEALEELFRLAADGESWNVRQLIEKELGYR